MTLEVLMKLEGEFGDNEIIIGAHLTGNRVGGPEMKSGSYAKKSLKNKIMNFKEAPKMKLQQRNK